MPNRAASTAYNYRNMARCHILPALADQPLRQLSPLKVQMYLYQKLSEGLSPNTVIKHYTMLFTALERAKRLELLDRNPMEQVLPSRARSVEHSFYSPAQLRILFRAVEGTVLELAVKLAAYLGLRRSEITGLRWKCVDLENKVILIQEDRTEVGGRAEKPSAPHHAARPAPLLCLRGKPPGGDHARHLQDAGPQLHRRDQQHLHPFKAVETGTANIIL